MGWVLREDLHGQRAGGGHRRLLPAQRPLGGEASEARGAAEGVPVVALGDRMPARSPHHVGSRDAKLARTHVRRGYGSSRGGSGPGGRVWPARSGAAGHGRPAPPGRTRRARDLPGRPGTSRAALREFLLPVLQGKARNLRGSLCLAAAEGGKDCGAALGGRGEAAQARALPGLLADEEGGRREGEDAHGRAGIAGGEVRQGAFHLG